MWGNIRKRKLRLNLSVMRQRAAQDTKPRKKKHNKLKP